MINPNRKDVHKIITVVVLGILILANERDIDIEQYLAPAIAISGYLAGYNTLNPKLHKNDEE